MAGFFRLLQKKTKDYSNKKIEEKIYGNDEVIITKKVVEILSSHHKELGVIKSDQGRENFLAESWDKIINDPTIQDLISEYGRDLIKIVVSYHMVQYSNNKITIEEVKDYIEEGLY